MSASAVPAAPRTLIRESLRIAGEKVSRDRIIEVRHPYSGELVGTIPKATLDDVKRALKLARRSRATRATPFS
jgi:acyl-CoA reductase-like NAD-dependent aldehyde dehydrogenase